MYEGVVCLACRQVHMVNPRTGKALGADERGQLANVALAASPSKLTATGLGPRGIDPLHPTGWEWKAQGVELIEPFILRLLTNCQRSHAASSFSEY